MIYIFVVFGLAIGMFLLPAAFAEEIITIFVGPELVECVGVGLQQCMMVRSDASSSWEYFYDNIQGFEFDSGYEYKLQVLVTDVENPPADSSSKKYELIQILDKKSSSTRHISYKGICAPGFVALGEICVLNDRCGPGAYPGKLCIMQGEVQPYLKPSQQGNAGISASDVICAEGLELIFKSRDGSPACVMPESVKKLEGRGWQKEKPLLACTLEYNPVCGVNGKTYGNMCMLNSEHIMMNHKGECGAQTQTEYDLDKKYWEIQNKVSSVSDDIYNGTYNGDLSLSEALQILEDGKSKLAELYNQYQKLPDESKTDKQIAMRFLNLDKMGFASMDSQIKIIKMQLEDSDTLGVFPSTINYTKQAPVIDSEKGYYVTEIADGIYWLVGSGYQTMFVTTGQGVIVIDAPQPIGEKYTKAVSDVTSEKITHMIYSHHHQDHTGAAGQIFPADITYVSHKQTADVLSEQNDPNRPVPTVTFDDDMYTLSVGNQTLEMHFLGNFHSNGDILILAPKQKVAMLVDLFRPDASPYRAFGVTPDIDLYLKTHDVLQTIDFDVLVSGHTNILATKDHIKTNKQFTTDVMKNAKKALDDGDSNPVESCIQATVQQWEGKLDGLDTFMTEHCQAMIDYHDQIR